MPTSSKMNSSKISKKPFRGVFTALVTPFLPDHTIDWKAFERIVQMQIEAQVAGLVICGTTGESPTLSAEEKISLFKRAIEIRDHAVNNGFAHIQVIAGTGSNDTQKTIHDSSAACHAGVDALLVVTPYYNKPSQRGLFAHFTAVADECSKPIILYNVPGRTGVSLSAETVAKLAKHKRIVGIKEATGNLVLLADIINALKANQVDLGSFSILSGDDVTYWPFLTCGGDGVISVASNPLPKEMGNFLAHLDREEVHKGFEMHQQYVRFFQDLFIESNPVPVKALMHHLGLMSEHVRLPLVPMAPENKEKLLTSWKQLS